MIPGLRQKFNKEFTEEKYRNFLKELDSTLKYPTDFRVSETPVFLSNEFLIELLKACNDLTSQISAPSFKSKTDEIIPSSKRIKGEEEHPVFLQLDFAICKNEDDTFIPKLIELQGFPSLFSYQYFLDKIVRRHFDIPQNFSSFFNGLDGEKYTHLLRKVILADKDPKNVILLEINPPLQKTRVDFACTEELTGIKTVNLSDVVRNGKKLFYKNNDKEIPVERIYNRVIYDELQRKNFKFNFSFSDDLDVEWAGHPNWFFKISKYSLPLLKGKYVPHCYFLNTLDKYPDDLSRFVLKPLFSFAGLGVEVNVTKNKLDKVIDRSNYILQEKVEYAPVIETPDGYARVEVRLMLLWDKEPILATNLVRTSKGKMMGVDFNKNKTWVGSNLAYHP